MSPKSGPLNARTVGDNSDLDLDLGDVLAVDGRKKSNAKRGRCEGSGRSGSRGKGGRGSSSGTRRLVSPSLEAFERLFSGKDFPMGSPVTPRNKPPGNVGQGDDKKTGRGGGDDGMVASVGKGGGGAIDGFEIALTRVVRAPRRSTSTLPTPSRKAEEKLAARTKTPCTSSSSGSASDGESDEQSDG